jgi:hypothetical protein
MVTCATRSAGTPGHVRAELVVNFVQNIRSISRTGAGTFAYNAGMRYMFLMYSGETPEGPSQDEIEYLVRTHSALLKEARQKGILVAVEGLKSSGMATTVRPDGTGVSLIVTDGPFAETKEQLAGYYILDCRDLDEAIEWAKRMPTSCKGRSGGIEIRPIGNLPVAVP